MAYASNSDLPMSVRIRYPKRCLDVFREVFNREKDSKKSDQDAFAVSHFAADNCMKATGGKPKAS